MLRGFVVIIVGGLGDVRGALIAGLALGLVEVLTAGYCRSGLKEAVAFLILVAVLWTRPVRPVRPRRGAPGVTCRPGSTTSCGPTRT